MTSRGYALFQTAIGACGIAWDGDVIVAAQLPEANDRVALERLARRLPDSVQAEPPAAIRRVMDRIVALISGDKVMFGDVALALDQVPDFHRKVYEVALAIPPGETLTYGEVARRIGEPGAAQAVGQALGKNPFPIIVPCHRVLAANGRTGGFSAHGSVATKLKLLSIERARTSAEPTLFDGDAGFGFVARPQR
jgi:methylated-DNA-[protein]-cysteine S-methyltransferase